MDCRQLNGELDVGEGWRQIAEIDIVGEFHP
jgi:hypothetical protein